MGHVSPWKHVSHWKSTTVKNCYAKPLHDSSTTGFIKTIDSVITVTLQYIQYVKFTNISYYINSHHMLLVILRLYSNKTPECTELS